MDLRGGAFYLKTTGKIILKIALLCAFLWITPFGDGLSILLSGGNFLDAFVYHQRTLDESISIKEQLNLLSYNNNLTIKDDFKFQTTQDTNKKDDSTDTPSTQEPSNQEPTTPPTQEPQTPPSGEVVDTGKKVYIYNTHQSEGYEGGETVMDAAAILGNKLEEKGVHVVLETANFSAYAKTQGWDYNQSYAVSNKFLNDALVNYGGFDLIIDFHRDAIPRESSYVSANGVNYAKLMPVIGGLTPNASVVSERASTLYDIMNAQVNGIMRTPMNREAYYNQQVSDRTILIECGGDVNPFDEVKNSMDVLAQGIYTYVTR